MENKCITYKSYKSDLKLFKKTTLNQNDSHNLVKFIWVMYYSSVATKVVSSMKNYLYYITINHFFK